MWTGSTHLAYLRTYTRFVHVGWLCFGQLKETEEILARHFGEWGPIEDVSVKPKHHCAFVRYRHRIYAEFGKVIALRSSATSSLFHF